MVTPNYLTNNAKKKIENCTEGAKNNTESLGPLSPHRTLQRPYSKPDVLHENNYVSTTPTTSGASGCFTDLEDMRESHSDGKKIEEEDGQLSEYQKTMNLPPTPSTTCSAEEDSFFSGDDVKPTSFHQTSSKHSFLERIESQIDDSMPEVFCDVSSVEEYQEDSDR